jgi:hypothetical protein
MIVASILAGCYRWGMRGSGPLRLFQGADQTALNPPAQAVVKRPELNR